MTEQNEGQSTENNPQPPATDGGQDDKPTLTQADVDKAMAAAKRGAKQQGVKEVLETLGVESPDALKQSLADAQAAKEAQMSDLEKAQAEAAKAKELIAQAEKDKADAIAQADKMLLDAAIITASQAFNDPNDALKFIDRSGIERSENGGFTGVEEAIKALGESKPYLLKASELEKPKGTPNSNRQQQPQGQPEKNALQTAWGNRPLIIF
jgi:hypothetical protein